MPDRIVFARKDPSHVTIAQISDLLFDADTRFPWDQRPNSALTRLAQDIIEQAPDILCVTGDIADRAIAEAADLKWQGLFSKLKRERRKNYRDFLKSLCLIAPGDEI